MTDSAANTDFDIRKYSTIIFDCDGVVLDSNKVKTQAFYNAISAFGSKPAGELVEYHVRNGGISRYKKFQHFFEVILESPELIDEEMPKALARYSSEVWQGLLKCQIAPELEAFREATPETRWLIVSGGDQEELRKLFLERKINAYFNGGIFGSPDTKDQILDRELSNQGATPGETVFIGDSRYDFESAKRAGLDFIFVSEWSESDFHFNGADYRAKNLSCIWK